MKIRGVKLTFPQRRIMVRNGLTEDTVDNYLLRKRTQVEEGNDHLSKYGTKQEIWTLIHRESGEIKEILVDRVSQ